VHRRALPLVGIALSAVAIAAQNQGLRDTRPLHSSVELTTVAATVTDKDGRLITGLPREAFEVFEDGDAQVIATFTHERVPVSLGMLLDVSDSMFGHRIKDARAAVEHFLFALLDPDDQFFLLAFNHEPHVLTKWTAVPDDVRRALDDVKPFGGTAIYDAIIGALPLMERRARQRAALVVISDGADTASDATVREVRLALLRSDAFVYAIAIDSPERQPINTRVNAEALREITTQSGGITQVVHDAQGLEAATRTIAEELNRQYLIGYSSMRPPDGEFHSIRVRVRGGEYRVRARNGYVAVPLSKRSER
jgi:Ca-activated chloride channel family protein